MLLTILLSFLQIIAGSDSKNLATESKSQAKYYISQIENGVNVEENIWALTILGSEKAEIKSFIEKESQKSNSLKAFNNFEENFQKQLEKVVFQTGSSNLLIATLLVAEDSVNKRSIYERYISEFDLPASQDIDYTALCEAIIKGKTVNGGIITDKRFLLPHFFLLFDDEYDTFLPREYLQNILENWPSNFSTDSNLHSILAEISYFRALYLSDKYSEIATLYSSLTDINLFPNSTIKLRLYQYLDYVMYQLGNFDRNLEIARTFTLPLSKYLEKKQLEVRIKFTTGINLYSIGKIHQAEKIYHEVLAETKSRDLGIPRASLFNNLALTYLKLGKYEQYLDLQFQALENAKASGNYSHQIKTLNNIFIYYRDSNDSKRALNYLEEAQKLAENKASSDDLGNIYISLGSFHRKFLENYSKAHKYYAKAEEILDAENARYYIKLLNEQAETFENQQTYSQAIKKHDQIIELTNNEKGTNYLDALVNKALVNLKIGNTEKARRFITKFNSYDLSKLDFQQIIKAKTVEANYLHQTGKSQKAIDMLGPTLDQVVTRAKSSADFTSGYWHVAQEFLNAFELTISIYQKIGQQDRAIQTLDQLKTINDASLYQNPLVKSSLLNESELTEYKRLTEQLDATRKKLLTAPEDQQFEIQQTISQLNLKKRKLDQKLTKQVGSKSISVREIQNHLSARELVLHITELNDQFYVANISRSDISINTIPIDSTLRNLLSGSVQQIATNETNLDSLYKISQILNLKDIPDYVEQVTLIPDSDFYQLPIDILPLEEPTHSYSYGDVTYAIEKFRTQYLTSIEDFIADPSEKSNSPNELNYTGYGISNFSGYNNQSLVALPFAQTEVSNIANRLTRFSNVRTFINEQSTKSTFEQTAPKSQIIHLATHSEVSERDPMFSTVYLSNTASAADSTFDSQIFAYELFELNLNNEMIMLNSCESGSGSFIQGTGVMGISRALRYAGANSLVLNLWSVNDMLASDFAVHFYDQLNEGKSKAEALRDTKRYFLNSKNASPHFWGPYMLIGNPDAIIEPNQNNNMAMAGTFIIYFLLMVGLSYLTQQGFIFRKQEERKAA